MPQQVAPRSPQHSGLGDHGGLLRAGGSRGGRPPGVGRPAAAVGVGGVQQLVRQVAARLTKKVLCAGSNPEGRALCSGT